jgi:flagellar protein FlaD
MAETEGDGKAATLEEFDLGTELSALVADKIIPPKIAEKLEQKLREKQVNITKEQLHALAMKIKELISAYQASGKLPETKQESSKQPTVQQKTDKPQENMLQVMDNIESLEQRIDALEKGLADYLQSLQEEENDVSSLEDTIKGKQKTSLPLVTTEEMQVPDAIGGSTHPIDLDPLTTIPSDPESIVVLMKWLQYLIDKCGRVYLSEVLEYYVDIGWISEEAKIGLLDYSTGITEENKKNDATRKPMSHLPSKDHIQSLLFIQKLKGNRMDKHFLDRINGELSKITKKLHADH